MIGDILNFVLNVLIIVLIIGFLVFIHELGHYIAARLTGMLVEEFSLGFGPKLFSKKIGETEYMIKAFPLGGYVKVLGESGEDEALLDISKNKEEPEEDVSNNPRSYTNKSPLARLALMIAGVTMNFILAFIIFHIWIGSNGYRFELPAAYDKYEPAFATKTYQGDSDLVYTELVEGGNAKHSGMPATGRIGSVNGVSVSTSKDFRSALELNTGKNVDIVVCTVESNDCNLYNVAVNDQSIIGIVLPSNYHLVYTYEGATKVFAGIANAVDNLKLMGFLLSGLLSTAKETGNYQDVAVNSFSSPIALYFVIDAFKDRGFLPILRLIGEFSFSLAIVNILPIPALDGGRIFLLLIVVIRRKPLNRKLENAIIQVSFYFMMFLMLAVVLKDIVFINVFRELFKI